MKRQTPPLDAIEAFLEAAQAASFREAADALAISPSAFSRRIQALEGYLETPLFDRSGPRPVLSPAGRRYLRAVQPAIDGLRAASLGTRSPAHTGPLRIMAPHSFTIGWLAQRLPDFLARHAGREVELLISRDLALLQMGAADVAIVSGPREWNGLVVEPLALMSGVLACAPLLVNGRPPPRQLHELAQHRLLSAVAPYDLWRTWLAGVGYDGPPLGEPTRYDTASLLYEAAAAGFGVTIAVPFLADRALESGRLLRVAGHPPVPLGMGYFLACSSARARRRADVRAFMAWVHEEAGATLKAFDATH